MEVESLQGFWPATSGYGKQLTRIETVQPNSPTDEQFSPGQSVWIGIKKYHVLEPTRLKVLICFDPNRTEHASLEFGCQIAKSARGPTTVLTVVNPDTSMDEAKNTFELLKPEYFSHLPNLETKARQGNAPTEIILEAQEGHYEIVVLGRQGKFSSTGLGSIARQILTGINVPILLVEASRPTIQRILICTAAGEPGKMDVLFGGRLARQTGAQVMVLHIPHPESSKVVLRRIERHLGQAQDTLEALGVPTEYRIKEYSHLVEGITREAEEGDYDLAVIGASFQPHPHQLRWMDIASQIIRETNRPVLVVPTGF
jgi:nucleotide-binding universal stress UspA family protein